MGKNFSPNKLDTLVGLKQGIHTDVSNMWKTFKKEFSKPSKAQIESFAETTIDYLTEMGVSL